MKATAFSLLAIFGFSLLSSCNDQVKEQEDQTVVTDTIAQKTAPEWMYVTAVSGLTLREEPNLQSKKLVVMPLGTKVKLVNAEEKTTMNVGGIDGAMDEIEYNNLKGYAFNGFMSRFSSPPPNSVAKNYAEEIKSEFPGLEYSEATGGTASKPSKTETLILPTDKWHEAFFLAQQLYDIPKEFAFPNPKGSNVETQWPRNNKKSGQGELQISRNNNVLEKIKYHYKSGKMANSVTITQENGFMKIEKSEKFE